MKTNPFSSPTGRLIAGLAVTLAAVAIFSWYALGQVFRLRDLQTTAIDRNRKDSLQLLRIQNNLNSLGLAMRDMLNGDEPYPLEAWKGQFERLRRDFDDALRKERQFAPAGLSPERQQYFTASLSQFWTSVDQVFTLAENGDPARARSLIRTSLEPQQAGISSTVARLLVQNNEAEEQAAARVTEIYRGVERNIYLFLAAVLTAILLKVVLEIVLAVKKRVVGRLRSATSLAGRVVGVATLLLVLPGSKLLVLELTSAVFGGAVRLGGFFVVTALIVTLMLARAGVRLLLERTEPEGRPG